MQGWLVRGAGVIEYSSYKRGFVTLNKAVIKYLPKCTHHLLYTNEKLQFEKYGTLSKNVFFVVVVVLSP